MEKLDNKSDFKWYKKDLDGVSRYEHRHRGEPDKYPCMVTSEFWDDPNGPYTYYHTFYFQQEVVCDKCGSKKMVWSGIDD